MNISCIWPNDLIGGCQVTLVENADLPLFEHADHGVHHPSVMKKHQVFLLPIVRIDKLWCDTRSLQSVTYVSHLFQVTYVRAIGI